MVARLAFPRLRLALLAIRVLEVSGFVRVRCLTAATIKVARLGCMVSLGSSPDCQFPSGIDGLKPS